MDKIKVDRLAYQSKGFVGNHVAIMLSDEGVREITSALKNINDDIHKKFFDAFSILSKIFKLSSASRFLTDEEVEKLCHLCSTFGEIYSRDFVNKGDTIMNKVY